MTYVRLWHLSDELMECAIELDLALRRPEVSRDVKRFQRLSEELARYVGACQYYLLERPVQYLPTRAPLQGLEASHGKKVSKERGLRMILQIARQLRQLGEGKQLSSSRLQWLLNTLLKMHEWVLAERSHERLRRRLAA